jgi:hypothetical protein
MIRSLSPDGESPSEPVIVNPAKVYGLDFDSGEIGKKPQKLRRRAVTELVTPAMKVGVSAAGSVFRYQKLRRLGSAMSADGSIHFILPSGRHIKGLLLFLKILSFRKPNRLPLAALQITFSILVHFSASMPYLLN